jgi:hypothetical protein
MRTAAKRTLGNKKKIKKSSKKTKIKLKIKSSSPEGVANAVSKLAGTLGNIKT